MLNASASLSYVHDELDNLTQMTNHTLGQSIGYDYDGNGNMISMTGPQGEVRYLYDQLNRLVEQYDPVSGAYRYEYDSWLMYYRARYYQPDVGRFTTEDSALSVFASPPTFHRYTYAFNAPTHFADPSGRFPWLVVVIGVVLGVIAGYTFGQYLQSLPPGKGHGIQRTRDHMLPHFFFGFLISLLLLVPGLFLGHSFAIFLGAACNLPGLYYEYRRTSTDWGKDLIANLIGCILGFVLFLTLFALGGAALIAFFAGFAVGYLFYIYEKVA